VAALAAASGFFAAVGVGGVRPWARIIHRRLRDRHRWLDPPAERMPLDARSA